MNLEDYKRIANTAEGWIEVIKIFAKHEGNGMSSKLWFEADHDIIYSPVDAGEVSADSEDGLILEALGWFLNEEVDCWSMFT